MSTTNTARKVSKYGVFLILIFLYLDWIRENTDTFHAVKPPKFNEIYEVYVCQNLKAPGIPECLLATCNHKRNAWKINQSKTNRQNALRNDFSFLMTNIEIIYFLVFTVSLVSILLLLLLLLLSLLYWGRSWGSCEVFQPKVPYYAKMGACPMKNSGMAFTFMWNL